MTPKKPVILLSSNDEREEWKLHRFPDRSFNWWPFQHFIYSPQLEAKVSIVQFHYSHWRFLHFFHLSFPKRKKMPEKKFSLFIHVFPYKWEKAPNQNIRKWKLNVKLSKKMKIHYLYKNEMKIERRQKKEKKKKKKKGKLSSYIIRRIHYVMWCEWNVCCCICEKLPSRTLVFNENIRKKKTF